MLENPGAVAFVDLHFKVRLTSPLRSTSRGPRYFGRAVRHAIFRIDQTDTSTFVSTPWMDRFHEAGQSVANYLKLRALHIQSIRRRPAHSEKDRGRGPSAQTAVLVRTERKALHDAVPSLQVWLGLAGSDRRPDRGNQAGGRDIYKCFAMRSQLVERSALATFRDRKYLCGITRRQNGRNVCRLRKGSLPNNQQISLRTSYGSCEVRTLRDRTNDDELRFFRNDLRNHFD
jgi:hypothetical protein